MCRRVYAVGMSKPDGPKPDDPDLLTYDGASRFLKTKRSTLYAMVSRGRIPHIRLGGRFVRFDKKILRRWLAEHTVPVRPGD